MFTAGEWQFGFHGFIGGSVYVQDTPGFVLNGQGPMLVLNKPGGAETTGVDVRQSRLNFSIAGPRVFGGALPKAVAEMDFFGLNSPGGYGEVSAYPRLRLAYAELAWAHDVIRIGQDHELIFALVPESVGHQAFPVTYFNGLIGWREPAVAYFHTFQMDGSKLELAVQVAKSDWENPYEFGNATTLDLNVDYGQLSGLPAFEGRIKWTSDALMVFVAGHYSRVGGSHAGDLVIAPMTVPNRDWDVYAGVAGLKLTVGDLTAMVSGYAGKNLGPFLGDLLQFPVTADVNELGGWAQLGYKVLPSLSFWAVGGTSRPNENDMKAVAASLGGVVRTQSSLIGGMIRLQEGGFAFGAEYNHIIAKNENAQGEGAPSGTGATDGNISANQAMLSGMFFF